MGKFNHLQTGITPDGDGLKSLGNLPLGFIFFGIVSLALVALFLLDIKLGKPGSGLMEIIRKSTLHVASGLVALAFFMIYKRNPWKMAGSAEAFFRHILYSLLFIPLLFTSLFTGWSILVAVHAINTDWYLWLTGLEIFTFTIPGGVTPLYQMIYFGTIIIIAPLVEEFIFRGMLLNHWSRKRGTAFAIIASSFIFGILHLNPVGAFLFSVALSLVYIKSGSLPLVILIHMLHNVLATGAYYIVPDYPDWSVAGELFRHTWFIVVTGVASLMLVLALCIKWWPQNGDASPMMRS